MLRKTTTLTASNGRQFLVNGDGNLYYYETASLFIWAEDLEAIKELVMEGKL